MPHAADQTLCFENPLFSVLSNTRLLHGPQNWADLLATGEKVSAEACLEQLRCFYWLVLNNPELFCVLSIFSWAFPLKKLLFLVLTSVNLKWTKCSIFITSCRAEALLRTSSCRTVSISVWHLPEHSGCLWAPSAFRRAVLCVCCTYSSHPWVSSPLQGEIGKLSLVRISYSLFPALEMTSLRDLKM